MCWYPRCTPQGILTAEHFNAGMFLYFPLAEHDATTFLPRLTDGWWRTATTSFIIYKLINYWVTFAFAGHVTKAAMCDVCVWLRTLFFQLVFNRCHDEENGGWEEGEEEEGEGDFDDYEAITIMILYFSKCEETSTIYTS